MEISTVFDLGQKVRIKPLEDIEGRIQNIRVDRLGIRYEVKYYYNAKEEYALLEEDEIGMTYN